MPPAAQAVALAAPAPRRIRPVLQVLIVVGVILAVPALAICGWFAKITIDAGKGMPSPDAALLGLIFTFEDPPDALGVDRLIVPERRNAIKQQRLAYMAEMAKDARESGWTPSFETGWAPDGAPKTSVFGNTATVYRWHAVRWFPPDHLIPERGSPWQQGPNREWKAEARDDGDGWRLVSLTIPPWCDDGTNNGYSLCNRRHPSTEPSPSSTDPLDRLRSALPCGLRDPYRSLRTTCDPSVPG
jgi:hypothetical protein